MGKLKVLVLGDGLLGSELVKQTGWDYISRKKDGIDLDKFNDWMHKMSNYDVIVNCIANTDTYSTDKTKHWDINYKFVNTLISFCNECGTKLVHISSDYVYTGSVTNASEEDVPVHCNNWYGYTKLLGDGLVQLLADDYLVIRCTHKPNPFPYDSAWINQIGNFDYVNEIATLIIHTIVNNPSGIVNVGSDVKTMYELASVTKPNVGKSFIPSHVPQNTSMDTNKMIKIITDGKFSL